MRYLKTNYRDGQDRIGEVRDVFVLEPWEEPKEKCRPTGDGRLAVQEAIVVRETADGFELRRRWFDDREWQEVVISLHATEQEAEKRGRRL